MKVTWKLSKQINHLLGLCILAIAPVLPPCTALANTIATASAQLNVILPQALVPIPGITDFTVTDPDDVNNGFVVYSYSTDPFSTSILSSFPTSPAAAQAEVGWAIAHGSSVLGGGPNATTLNLHADATVDIPSSGEGYTFAVSWIIASSFLATQNISYDITGDINLLASIISENNNIYAYAEISSWFGEVPTTTNPYPENLLQGQGYYSIARAFGDGLTDPQTLVNAPFAIEYDLQAGHSYAYLIALRAESFAQVPAPEGGKCLYVFGLSSLGLFYAQRRCLAVFNKST